MLSYFGLPTISSFCISLKQRTRVTVMMGKKRRALILSTRHHPHPHLVLDMLYEKGTRTIAKQVAVCKVHTTGDGPNIPMVEFAKECRRKPKTKCQS